jgi:hypothetical protein
VNVDWSAVDASINGAGIKQRTWINNVFPTLGFSNVGDVAQQSSLD